MKEIFNEFIKPIIKQPWYIILGSIVGGFGIVNVLDSIIYAILKQQWALIPPWFSQLLRVFRDIIHPVFDYIFGWLNIKLAGVWKDYFSMGFIVMFMRLRSTTVIAKAIKKGDLDSYEQRVFNRVIVVKKNSSRFTWFLFYSSRLVYALLLWPEKLFGAMLRFTTGKKRTVAKGQYIVFFSSVFFAVFFILVLAICKAAGSY